MKNIADKSDTTAGALGQLPAAEYNDHKDELQESVERTGQILDVSITDQLAQAMFINGTSAETVQDGGSVNTILLSPITGASGLAVPKTYASMNGAVLRFNKIDVNTSSAVVVNFGQSGTELGAKTLIHPDGTAVKPNEVVGDCLVKWDNSLDKWILLSSKDTIQTEISSKGLIIGDSTIAAYLGQQGVDYFLLTPSDTLIGTTILNQAVPGDTIAQQKTIYLADAEKGTYDWIIVQVGLNDINDTDASTVAIAALQDLINTINANKKATAVIIVSGLIYALKRWEDIFGAGAAAALANQTALQVAIFGGGANPITGLYYRNYNHVNILSDKDQYLYDYYSIQPADGIHENDRGRYVIAQTWRESLNRLGYLNNLSEDKYIPVAPISGQYIPVLTEVLGANTLGAVKTQWMRVGNYVQVSGLLTANITAGSISFEMSLPVVSDITLTEQCGGVASSNTVPGSLAIFGSIANDRAVFAAQSMTTGVSTWTFTFGYYIEE